MSEWYTIENQEDVEISKDGTQIEVLFNSNDSGNCYIEIPIEYIINVLANQEVKK